MLPLNMSNVDTDQIMPKQFLKRVERSGYGEFLFYDWKKEPDFPLNNEAYQGSKVLVAGDNFGTGSSREHAPWGLQDWGFDAIISTKFADIFRLNSINICLVPIETSQENIEALFAAIIDANITTLLAAVILFFMGSGPVKGFSVTLGVGIFTTLFSVYFIARLFTSLYVSKNRDKEKLI